MGDARPLPADYTGARDQVERAIQVELSRVLETTVDQLSGPIQAAANRLVYAARAGRRDLVEECRDQLDGALRERAVTVRPSMSLEVDVFIDRGLGLLFDGLVAGLTGLAVPR